MANKKTIKQTFTIEQLGCPVVSYRYKGALRDHLIAFGGSVCDLPTKYLNLDVDFDNFHECFKQRISEALQDAMCELPGFDTIIDIEPVMPKIDYYNTSYPQVAIDKWQFTFREKEADTYGIARAISDRLPWDEIIVRINEFMADNLKMNDGFCAWDAWTPEKSDEAGYDSRWVNLYISTDERNSTTAYSHGTATEYNTFRLDEIIRKAAAVKGRLWRNYCSYHELPVVHEAMDFMCWVLDNRIDFEQFLSEIGVVYDPYTLCTRPELDCDIFAVPQQNNETTKQQNNNTTMTQTNSVNSEKLTVNNAPKGWKAQPARPDMTASEYEALYYDRFFKEQLGKVKIDQEGHSLIDLMQLSAVQTTWSTNDIGSRVILTIKFDGFESRHMFDLKNNGARANETTIGGVTYKWISLPKMAEAILKFDGQTPPADIQNYCSNKIFLAEGKEGKEVAPKTEEPHAKTEEREEPKPQTAPTAKLRKEPVAQQTTPNSSLLTPHSSEAPAIAPAPSTTDATFYYDTDKHFYHLYCDEDGVNGGVVIVRQDGSVNSHIKHRDFAQMSAFIASKKMTRVEQLSDALMKALVKEGVVSALAVSEQPKSEEVRVKSEEVSAAPQEPLAEVKECKKETPKPEPQKPHTEVKECNEKLPSTPLHSASTTSTPEAKVVPFTLPDTIVAGDLKDGRMTLTGLTDLTAEQVQIFIAGMNAMKEAIKKQMKLTGTDNLDLPF